MPVFNFRCYNCGFGFEELVLFDGEEIKCPICEKSEDVRKEKEFYPPAIQFKGSGFYVNDIKKIKGGD